MMAPVLNIVTGSTSEAGDVMPKTPVPPFLIAPAGVDPPDDVPDEALLVPQGPAEHDDELQPVEAGH